MKSVLEIDFGSKCQKLFLNMEKEKDVLILKKDFLSCYKEIGTYLKSRLPHDSTVLKDLQYFNPNKLKLIGKSKFAIGRTAFTLATVLGRNITKNATVEEFSDTVKNELQILQTEKVTFTNNHVVKFWREIGSIVDEAGEKRFLNLSRLALAVLCISHGNAVPE